MKIKYPSLIVAALCFLGVHLYADDDLTHTNKYPWESSAAAGLTLTKGNSDTLLLTAKLQTQRKMPGNEYSFDLDGTYGKTEGLTSAESLHGFAQWNHMFTDRFYGYARAEGLRDAIADVKYRITVGPGAGYYFIKEKQTTLAAEAGVSEVFQRLGTNSTAYTTLRLAERFEHKFQSGARVWENVEFLPRVDRFQEYLINGEVGVEASLAKNLSLQTYVDDNYNSKPAAGRKRNDVKLVSAVAYKF
jgi:putative salt-induced outer membrane protein YdiY